MLAKPAGRFATTIQPGNDLAMHVDHLPGRVDKKPSTDVVYNGVAQAA
jgi:hypothetical protein